MDFKKLKAKLLELESTPGSGGKLWKPKVGKQVIRLLPYKHQPEWPFVELYFYYDLVNPKKTLLSPLSFGKADPVQEFADSLKATGDKDDYRLAKNLEPKFRAYVPILVRGEEEDGVKFWGFGKQVYGELLKTIEDPDYGDITDLKTGRDITIEFEAATGPNTYPSTTLRVKPDRTVATENKTVADAIKEMDNISNIWKEPTYDELKTYLDIFLNVSDEPAEDSTNENSADTKSKTAKTSDPVLATDFNKIVDDFDDLFKDM